MVVFALGELFGTSCIVMLVIWQQLKLFLPDEGQSTGSTTPAMHAGGPLAATGYRLFR